MDYQLFESVINADGRSKGEILRECGISYPGFAGAISSKSIKVSFLEKFCVITKTHISRFFEDWTVEEGEKQFPDLNGFSKEIVYSSNLDLEVLLQMKDLLINEQRMRINELTEVLHLYKSGKVRIEE